MSEPKPESEDTVWAIRQLRAMGALEVSYQGCTVRFAELPMRSASKEDAEAEYQRIALASAG